MSAALDQAVAAMRRYRLIHLRWARYFEEHPEVEAAYAETVDGHDEQLAIVREYDRVLRLLGELRRLKGGGAVPAGYDPEVSRRLRLHGEQARKAGRKASRRREPDEQEGAAGVAGPSPG